MERRLFVRLMLFFAAVCAAFPIFFLPAAHSQVPQAASDDANTVEIHRLQIVNEPGGAIQVSSDGGATWRLIGRVLTPATTVAEGYTAAQYAPQGTVAAIAVHGLRLRVGDDDPHLRGPLVLSIDPKEYINGANVGFGGHIAGSSGIFTDIPAGTSIFRDLCPLVGNRVFLQSSGGRLFPLPPTFRPTGTGETLVIPVRASRRALTQVTFENKIGGAVEGTFADGKTVQITGVVKPVLGVGRFDGTIYTGLGKLNTAHTGVLTVCTTHWNGSSREGEGTERRGGFQISPAWHNNRTEEAGAPMVLTVGSPNSPHQRELEGVAPLFSGAIGLGDALGGDAQTDVSIDDGPWEPMPLLIGSIPDAFTGPGLTAAWKAQNINRTCLRGVTSFRLRLPVRDADRTKILADAAANAYRTMRLQVARKANTPIVQGILTINANPTNKENVAFVRLLVEGIPRGLTNVAPFALSWDTTRVDDGEYLVQADAMDANGAVLATTRRKVFVLNHAETAPTTAKVTQIKESEAN